MTLTTACTGSAGNGARLPAAPGVEAVEKVLKA